MPPMQQVPRVGVCDLSARKAHGSRPRSRWLVSLGMYGFSDKHINSHFPVPHGTTFRQMATSSASGEGVRAGLMAIRRDEKKAQAGACDKNAKDDQDWQMAAAHRTLPAWRRFNTDRSRSWSDACHILLAGGLTRARDKRLNEATNGGMNDGNYD